MCIMSMVMDYGRRMTDPYAPPVILPWPQTFPIDPEAYRHEKPVEWTREAWDEYQKLLRQAEKVDQLTGQEECEDPEKGSWMADVEAKIGPTDQADDDLWVAQRNPYGPPATRCFLGAFSYEIVDGWLKIYQSESDEQESVPTAMIAIDTVEAIEWRRPQIHSNNPQAPAGVVTSGFITAVDKEFFNG